MPSKKRKPLTNKQKQERRETKKRLQNEGLIPPDKPPLNRKAFAKQVIEEYEASGDRWELATVYIPQAVAWMICEAREPVYGTISSECIGVLKLLKIGMDIELYMSQKRAAGEHEYKVMDLYEQVVKPVMKL